MKSAWILYKSILSCSFSPYRFHLLPFFLIDSLKYSEEPVSNQTNAFFYLEFFKFYCEKKRHIMCTSRF